MGYSAVAVTDGQSIDEVAPGAPGFLSVNQIDNHSWEATVQLPNRDADDSDLTGLTKLTVATLPMTGGENPFTGLSMPEILALPGVNSQDVALTPDDAGQTKTVTMPLVNLGGFQAFAAAVSD